jgi:hypothetical protein
MDGAAERSKILVKRANIVERGGRMAGCQPGELQTARRASGFIVCKLEVITDCVEVRPSRRRVN